MKISFALIAGALSQSTNSSVTSLPEQGIPEVAHTSDTLLSASNSSSISDLEVCEKGSWGTKCFSNCNCGGNACDKKSGKCEGDVGVCPPHYKGPRCDVPVCKDFCAGEGSLCVAPHRCVCVGHYTQGSYQLSDVKNKDGVPYTMYYCSSNRAAGLKGALSALVILIVSISLCACIQTNATGRDRRKQYEYIAETEQ
ncbi:unnamed protein product [Oikopleura dioica]|uniref:Uncharacterized protein n=1 Tax=Oikopleura dioica TaxID=34765 RepID=E4XGS6_OIKDI|nr:unnamed protein product [Oikopleura dioica]